MEKYVSPVMRVIDVKGDVNLLAASGVSTGSTVGNEYTNSDVTYSKGVYFGTE